MSKKFEYNEIVIVHTTNPKIKEIDGEKGYIAADAFDTNTNKWLYGVLIFKEEIVYSCYEDELETTGEFYKED